MEFDEWLDSGTEFSIGGRTYRVEPPSALAVLRLHRVAVDSPAAVFEREHVSTVLGGTWTEMLDAGVAEAAAMHAGRAVVANYLDSAERALSVWTLQPMKPREQVPKGPIVVHGLTLVDGEEPPGTLGPGDPGGGPYDAKLGQREWYFPAKWAPKYSKIPPAPRDTTIGWRHILGAWDALTIDLQAWGVDLTPELLGARPWQWLAVRLSALLGDPTSRIRRTIDARKVTGGDSAG